MAQLGNYKIPKQFKDEDRWFKFFTKKQLLILGIGIALSMAVLAITSAIHLTGIGIICLVLNLAVSACLAFVPMPADRYLLGGGYPLLTIVLRLINKYLIEPKVLYVKNYEKQEM